MTLICYIESTSTSIRVSDNFVCFLWKETQYFNITHNHVIKLVDEAVSVYARDTECKCNEQLRTWGKSWLQCSMSTFITQCFNLICRLTLYLLNVSLSRVYKQYQRYIYIYIYNYGKDSPLVK